MRWHCYLIVNFMGNTVSTQSAQTINVENCFKDFKEFQFIERIQINRFLKTILAKYSKDNFATSQKVIAKLYVCSSDQNDLHDSISNIIQLNRLFRNMPFVLTYNRIHATEKVCIATRSYVHQNLYDRLSTRPFLTKGEKIWILYQILRVLKSTHCYMAHGDLKLENILLTSWGFVVLSDFTFRIKPTLLSNETVIAEYDYFFDTSNRQSCYIAPERLIYDPLKSHSHNKIHQPEKKEPTINFLKGNPTLNNIDLIPSMDIFSLGCVIFQIFTDGKILFKLTKLLSYCRHELSFESIEKIVRENIENDTICNMICNMININPENRLFANEYLENKNIFPTYFDFMYKVALNIAHLDPSPEIIFHYIQKQTHKLIKIIKNTPKIHNHDPDSAYLFIINILTSVSTKLKLNKFKIDFFNLMINISKYLNCDIILNRILPYILLFIKDSDDDIRQLIPYYTIQLVKGISTVYSIEEANLFSDYIFPKLRKLETDPSLCVRIELAKAVPELYSEALRYHFLIKEGVQSGKIESSNVLIQVLDFEVEFLYATIQNISKALLLDTSSLVRRIYINCSLKKVNKLLTSILPLDRVSSDHLLSHLISVLNNNVDWNLRQSFYDVLPSIILTLGQSSINAVYPLLLRGLKDPCEWVVYSSLKCVSFLFSSHFIPRQKKHELLNSTIIFLIHPNPSIRRSCVFLISSFAALHDFIDQQENVIPLLLPYLKMNTLEYQVPLTNPFALILSIISPIPNIVFEALINRQASHRFLDFLKRNSELITNNRFNDIHYDEFFEIHDDSVQSFFDLFQKNGSDNFLCLYKLLIIDEYAKAYIKELPIVRSSSESDDFLQCIKLKTVHPKIKQDINLLDNYTMDLSKKNCLYSSTSSINDSNDVEYNNTICKQLESYLKDTIWVCKNDLVQVTKKRMKLNKEYVYANFYIKNYKYNFIDDFRGQSLNSCLFLVSQFKPHSSSVNRICCFDNSSHFITVSDDCTVKIWDSNLMDASKLSLNFQPTYVYNQMSGRISSVKNIRVISEGDSFSRVACSSADDSDIQIFNLLNKTKDGKVDKHPFHRCIIDLNRDGFVVELSTINIYSNPILMASTLYGSVLGYDIRDTNCNPTIRFSAPKQGYFTSLECDTFGCWVAAGTNKGVINLWDVRFPSTPVKSIQTSNNNISRMKINCMDFKKIICCYQNTTRPVSIINLETGREEATFSTFSSATTCTGVYNINIAGSLHVFFSCTDGIIRDWDVYKPETSSILVPSIKIVDFYDKISYLSRKVTFNGPLETKESLYPDSITDVDKKDVNISAIKSFCTDISFIPFNNLLIAGMADGSIS
ncbi:hypothetical protein HZS_6964, partial [Henneguya salminicola]